jgi:uncharacterized protein (TIGR03435 family)
MNTDRTKTAPSFSHRRLSAFICGPLFFVVFVSALCAAGQPEFEVASIKPSIPDGRYVGRVLTGGPGSDDPGRVKIVNLTLKGFIGSAWDLYPARIEGPSWINDQHFDIVATLPKGTTYPEMQKMLQNLLIDRFELRLHHESRERKTYRLVVAKNGPKIAAAKADSHSAPDPTNGAGGIDANGYPILRAGSPMAIRGNKARARGQGKSLQDLAELLTKVVGLPVADATGLHGLFDYEVFWDNSGVAGPGMDPDVEHGPDIFTALREQLGLGLETVKGSVDMLVVDSARKMPAEN